MRGEQEPSSSAKCGGLSLSARMFISTRIGAFVAKRKCCRLLVNCALILVAGSVCLSSSANANANANASASAALLQQGQASTQRPQAAELAPRAASLLIGQLLAAASASGFNGTAARATSKQQPQVQTKPAQGSNSTSSQEARRAPVEVLQQARFNVEQGANLSQMRQRWRQLERSLGDSLAAVGAKLRLGLDELGERKIGPACRFALAELADGLGQHKLWPALTLDASARLPSGLLEGTLTELGNFDQCLAIRYPREWAAGGGGGGGGSARGQYCSLVIKPPLPPRPRLHTVCQQLPNASSNSTSPAGLAMRPLALLAQNSHQLHYAGLRLGVCTPSKCSQWDLQQLLTAYLAKFELLGQVKSCQVARDEQQQQHGQLDTVQRSIL